MKKLFLSVVMMVATISVGFTQKLGHINSADLLAKMPEVTSVDKELGVFQKSLEDQFNSMADEYKSKLDDYQAKASLMTDAIKKVKEKELMDLEKRINEFQVSAQDNLAQKKQELLSPILKKAEDAIKAVAKENGYNYIFDSSVGALLHFNESDDIMPMVKSKLGL